MYEFFFCFLVFVFWVYVRLVGMNESFETQIRNVDWELFLLYQSGDAERVPNRVAGLWAELDRLEALVELDG